MILYYALTTYHIQCCVLHRLTRKKNETAVLLLSDIHKNSVAFLERYKNSGIFDDVLLLEESEVNANIKQREQKHRSKQSILKSACSEIKKVLPINLNSADELYLCPDHFPFGWYVIKNKIKYHCFEEGCGVLSDNKFLMSNMSRNKTQTALMNTLGYFGENDSCVEILADTQAQVEGFEHPKMVDFSVKRILEELDVKTLERVLSFFGVTEIVKAEKNTSLILTQHMANLGIMPLCDQHRLYELFADYFLENTHIAVKPHPDDIAGRYKDIFGDDCTVLPFAMPSELLPYVFDGRVKTAIAAYSTAVKNLGNFCDRMICFDNRIMEDFRHIHRYFAAVQLVEYLKQSDDDIVTNGNELLIAELAKNDNFNAAFKFSDEMSGFNGCAVISDKLIEDNTIEDITAFISSGQNKGFIVFLNEKQMHIYFNGKNKEVFSKIRPIFIEIAGKEKKVQEVIYLYSEDKKTLEKAENFSLTKELKYTGVTIDLHSISKSEGEKIKMLEGVLEATEKRLNGYIANKKAVDAELESRGIKL